MVERWTVSAARMWCGTVVVLAGACTRPEPPAVVAAQQVAGPSAAAPLSGTASAAAAEPPATPGPEGSPNEAASPLRAVGPVATVNAKDIGAAAFNAELDKLVGTGARIPTDRLRRIAHNIIARLVENELRAQAIVEHGIVLTRAEEDEAWREFTQRFVDEAGRLDEERMHTELRNARSSPDQVRDHLRQQALGKKLVGKLGRVDVSEAEMRTFYDDNPSAWVEMASRDVRAILIRVGADASKADKEKAEARAQQAHDALKAGGDFELLAKTYGDGPQAPLHLVRNSGQPELENVAFNLKVGEIAPPVQTRWGWYVLRLVEKNEQRTKPFVEVRGEIRKSILSRKAYLEERRILQELRRKANVVEHLPF
ncbi:MAG: peptidyl-prolyl cis-trans isomerase [Deltaproteobacteria bacterium]|nr:peptidyl-prolyl cis-trans isomerase [Deltaproteobacteria bacterium]